MSEIQVRQRTEEWFELRQCVQLTASKFGEALGVGRGKPYDFFLSLLSDCTSFESGTGYDNHYTKHGNEMEPILNEAYQLLTGNTTQESGFWLPSDSSNLSGLVGASPDAKVLNKTLSEPVGLVEYKAPVHRMYDLTKKHTHNGIPRNYMAQMQGQMLICNLPWCDFMATCCQTKDIRLLRVYAQPEYMLHMSSKLHDFCLTLREARQLKSKGQTFADFPGAVNLKSLPLVDSYLPGEDAIVVENLLQTDSKGRFCSLANFWMDYDFLMGNPSSSGHSEVGIDYQSKLNNIDKEIFSRQEGYQCLN